MGNKYKISFGRGAYRRVVKKTAREFIEEMGVLVNVPSKFSLYNGKSLESHCHDVANALSHEHLIALMANGRKERVFSDRTMRTLCHKYCTSLSDKQAHTSALADVMTDLLVYDVAKLLRKAFRRAVTLCR